MRIPFPSLSRSIPKRINLITKIAKLFLGLLASASISAGAEPLKVAIIEALTCPAETVGRPFAQSTRLALDEINASGGYNGEPIAIKQYDNLCAADTIFVARSDIQWTATPNFVWPVFKTLKKGK